MKIQGSKYLIVLKTANLFLSLAGCSYILLYFYFSGESLFLKPNLNGFEDASTLAAKRILDGLHLYSDADIDYVPLIYGPLYFYLIAPLYVIFPYGQMAGRLISIFSTLGSLFFFFLLLRTSVKKFHENFLLFTVGAGLLLSSYKLTTYNLTAAKVDALFVFLISGALFFFRMAVLKKPSYAMAAGFFGSLLFFSKQTGILLGVLIAVALFLYNKKKALYKYCISFFFFTGIFIAFFYAKEGGNFFLYTIFIPKSHPIFLASIVPEFFKLFYPSILLFLLVILYPFYKKFKTKTKKNDNRKLILAIARKNVLFPLFAVGGLFMISFLGRAKAGAVANSWIFLIFGIALLSSIALQHTFLFSAQRQSVNHFEPIFTALVLIIISYQFYIFSYHPKQIFRELEEIKTIEKTIEKELCRLPQPVLMPATPFYPYLFCGGKTFYLAQSVQDILKNKPQFEKFYQKAHNSFTNRIFGTIISPDMANSSMLKSGISLLELQLVQEKNQSKKGELEIFKKTLELELLKENQYTVIPDSKMNEVERNLLRHFPGMTYYGLR